MYDNILHKPLNLRPGVSLTAWSILEELLEKDRQNRLGAKEDFVCISLSPTVFELIYYVRIKPSFMWYLMGWIQLLKKSTMRTRNQSQQLSPVFTRTEPYKV